MRWKPYLIGVICGGVLAVGALFICLALIGIGSRPGVHWGGGGVAVVEIDGGIYVADEIVAELEEARRTEHVKAVVLRINSPGGAVGASQEIYQAAMALNGVKPVVASMGQVAASGGYYVALPARQIFAMPGTITGSIGVRMSVMDAGELFRWARLAPEVLKSGRYKDAGSLYRPLSVEERALFAGILEDMHGQFKAAVVSSRQLPADLVDRIADGRVLTGREALSLKLIDAVGGLPDAIAAAGSLAGIVGEPKVVPLKRRRPWWVDFVWADAGTLLRQGADAVRGVLFAPRIGYWAF